MARATRTPGRTTYDVHPGVAMMQKWIAELPEKTGRSLAAWIKFVQKSGPPTEPERRDWLKHEYKLGANASWWIAERAESGKAGTWDDDPASYLKAAAEYVEGMYAGPKAALRPIHDELIKLARKLGQDVRICPCKTIVPLYREHVFAQIKPSTNTRIDFGLALAPLMGKRKLPARLIDTGGLAKKDRITHRIPLASRDQIDDELRHWLHTAHELDA